MCVQRGRWPRCWADAPGFSSCPVYDAFQEDPTLHSFTTLTILTSCLDGMGGLDEMGPEVWAVNWDHYPISRDSAELRYPNQIWEPVSQWAKAGNIGKMIDELGRVRLLHRYATHLQINKRMVLESAANKRILTHQ